MELGEGVVYLQSGLRASLLHCSYIFVCVCVCVFQRCQTKGVSIHFQVSKERKKEILGEISITAQLTVSSQYAPGQLAISSLTDIYRMHLPMCETKAGAEQQLHQQLRSRSAPYTPAVSSLKQCQILIVFICSARPARELSCR